MTAVDATDAKRALAALASGSDASGRTIERVVADAERGVESLPAAARFCDEWGLEALREAVTEAERRDEQGLSERGRRALAAFVRVRRAASGDHFRSGHGRDLRPDRER